MLIADRFLAPIVGIGLFLGAMTLPCMAFDTKNEMNEDSSPFALFKFGFSAYKNGHKDEAVKALRFAAEKGHQGANWKLGRMYAEGDGVKEDDYEAYKMFEQVIQEGADQGTENESYVADALVALAGYVKRGIPNSPINSNPSAARDLYLQAASNFGDPDAQFELGKMLMRGEGGSASPNQAARWFRLSAQKGHAGAQAMLGNLLFQAGKTVRGLAMMTAALEHATGKDRIWIGDIQEQAFSIADEADRRTAMVLAGDIVKTGDF
ncbi:tetratricopeptide repeat protein [Phyllobacterium ifriqiyense]|uniref:tetratricopeptide repeat protein n=1 Tax=Phyllobacterium TaxID=28100 RepID=UPI00348A744D